MTYLPMNRSILALLLASAACATPGAGTHDMSGPGHEQAARSAESAGATKQAAEHHAAAAQLQKNEAQACSGLSAADRQKHVLEYLSIVEVSQVTFVSVLEGSTETIPAGGQIVVRGDSGMSIGRLQQLLTCHIAHQEAAGSDTDMKDCPLGVRNTYATVTTSGPGYVIQVLARQGDSVGASEIWRRAQLLPRKG